MSQPFQPSGIKSDGTPSAASEPTLDVSSINDTQAERKDAALASTIDLAITALALSRSGGFLATGGDDNLVKLWDLKQILR